MHQGLPPETSERRQGVATNQRDQSPVRTVDHFFFLVAFFATFFLVTFLATVLATFFLVAFLATFFLVAFLATFFFVAFFFAMAFKSFRFARRSLNQQCNVAVWFKSIKKPPRMSYRR